MRPRSGRRYRAVLAAGVAVGMLLGAGDEAAWAGALLPERGGSPNADRIASLYTVVLVLAALVFAGVAVTLVFALVRYRERRSPVAAQIRGNTRLEIAWTVAAAGLIVFLAVFSILKLDAIEHPGPAVASPAAAAAGVGDGGRGALHIDVVGRQYVWMYKYPNGAFSYRGDGGAGRRHGAISTSSRLTSRTRGGSRSSAASSTRFPATSTTRGSASSEPASTPASARSCADATTPRWSPGCAASHRPPTPVGWPGRSA